LSVLSADNLIGLIVGVLLTVYLFVALVLPERF
jgi:K+-transporting ATPase KdpF subunit